MTSTALSPGRLVSATPGKRRALERLADDAGTFRMLAVDQRPPVRKLIAEKRGLAPDEPPDERDVIQVKQLLLEELGPLASAVLVDPHTAFPLEGTVGARQGLVLTLEDSVFDETPGGRRSKTIDDWSVDQIKRAGGDGVKLLAWYRPDADPGVREHQQSFVGAVGDECRRHDVPFVFELLLYPFPGSSDPVPFRGGERAEKVLESVETFADPRYGVDVFKVESPYLPTELPPPDDDPDDHLAAFRDLDRLIARPWVLLSGGADPADFERVLAYAYEAGASGYLAGRSIWWRAVSRFPDWNEMREVLRSDARSVMEHIDDLTTARARPLGASAGASTQRPGPDFCRSYPPASAAG